LHLAAAARAGLAAKALARGSVARSALARRGERDQLGPLVNGDGETATESDGDGGIFDSSTEHQRFVRALSLVLPLDETCARGGVVVLGGRFG
jgi:hypothetical protein